MSLAALTLRQVFSDILGGSAQGAGISYEQLLKMITPYDSYNNFAGSYRCDATFSANAVARENYENSSGQFTLYYEQQMKDGDSYKTQWMPVSNVDEAIKSSAGLCLKVNGRDEYKSIYELIKFDASRVYGDNALSQFRHDSGGAVAAVMYARSCYQRMIMLLHMQDMEAVNTEQRLINAAMTLLERLMGDLRAMDGGERNSSTKAPDPIVLAFMISRGLLEVRGSTGMVNESFINAVKAVLGLNGVQRKIPLGQDLDKNSDGTYKYQSVYNGVNGVINSHNVKLDQDRVAVWKDVIRIYGEQMSNDLSLRQTNLQQAMQLSQQELSTGTNLLGAVEKIKGDMLGNIR
jgi:hypothetical protein